MDQFYKDLVEKIRDAAEKDMQKIMGETGGSFLRRQLLLLCGSKQRMCLESEQRKLPALFRFPMMTRPRMWRTGRHNC